MTSVLILGSSCSVVDVLEMILTNLIGASGCITRGPSASSTLEKKKGTFYFSLSVPPGSKK
jgi:hypothetical protein